MLSPLRRWYAVVSCLIALALLTPSAQAQIPDPVWTWHNDIGRTGQYLHERTLTPTSLTTCNPTPCFGLLWQYPVEGQVYAQPLAIPNLSDVANCSGTCNVVFIATQRDKLYAFKCRHEHPTVGERLGGGRRRYVRGLHREQRSATLFV
jgi:hypothetical protein